MISITVTTGVRLLSMLRAFATHSKHRGEWRGGCTKIAKPKANVTENAGRGLLFRLMSLIGHRLISTVVNVAKGGIWWGAGRSVSQS